MAFVYDTDEAFERRVNPDTLLWRRLGGSSHWEEALRDHVARHVRETGSPFAARLLNNWAQERANFWHVVPKDYARYLAKPMEEAAAVAAE
jgi:glutamate synthase (NADPH/NADH) large chain